MKKKVSLLELVATNIIIAVLVATYYWMWARRDWHDYYMNIQQMIAIFTLLFCVCRASRIKKYKKETMDEMALTNLKRADSICLKIVGVASIVVAFTCALEIVNNLQVGYIIMALLVLITIIRTIIFYIMDKKGVEDGTENKDQRIS